MAARRVLIGGSIVVIGILAIGVSLASPEVAPATLGVLLIACGLIQAVHTLILNDPSLRRAELFGCIVSLLTGGLLTAWGELAFNALALLLGISWIADGVVKLVTALRGRGAPGRGALLFDAGANLLIGAMISIRWPLSGAWVVYVTVGIRLLTTGWSILFGHDVAAHAPMDDSAERHPDARLGLPPHPAVAHMRQQIDQYEERRWVGDRYWVIVLLIAFFAIHVGRMNAEWNLVGLISPAIAVAGDALFAIVLTYTVIVPFKLGWRFLLRPLERTAWRQRCEKHDAGRILGPAHRMISWWLKGRMRFSLNFNRVWHSPAAAIRRGLQGGMPATAVIIAAAPLLGVSWYFDTETWATGAWEKYAAHRTDAWREEMIRSVVTQAEASGVSADALFQVHPDIQPGQDFSFIVIGDTGEGDASQHVLRDQFLQVGARDDVKFLLIASDVIYPQGAMKDYEAKFYLPFKGFTKPIYAIPGNHDWYDALEAFSANFMKAEAARAAMQARRRADHRLTSTTEKRIDRFIDEAARLRRQYGLICGGQHAPFLEIQTERFALIAVDTGILRSVDPEQWKWLRAATERSRGKFKMVIPGHPFYAGGHDVSHASSEFSKLYAFLHEQGADVVMAGDTHDFEYYREHYKRDGSDHSMLHFVNGGGGAYISIGTALDWPDNPPHADCAFYPRTDAVIAKLDAEIPSWKQPIWYWVKRFGAWPSTPEVLAPAFASNRAPYFQCFVEVRVELSNNVVRLRPYTAYGRMKWQELQLIGRTGPSESDKSEWVEFTLPLPPAGPSP